MQIILDTLTEDSFPLSERKAAAEAEEIKAEVHEIIGAGKAAAEEAEALAAAEAEAEAEARAAALAAEQTLIQERAREARRKEQEEKEKAAEAVKRKGSFLSYDKIKAEREINGLKAVAKAATKQLALLRELGFDLKRPQVIFRVDELENTLVAQVKAAAGNTLKCLQPDYQKFRGIARNCIADIAKAAERWQLRRFDADMFDWSGSDVSAKAEAIAAVKEKYTTRCTTDTQEDVLKEAKALMEDIDSFNSWIGSLGTKGVVGLDTREYSWLQSIIHVNALTGKFEINGEAIKTIK